MEQTQHYIIKTATTADLSQIAACHVEAFPDSVTSLLGTSVVQGMLQWYLSAPNKFLFWIEASGKCIGYCGGLVIDGTDAYGSASGMSQFGFAHAVKAFLRKPWLLLHPEIRSRYPFILTNISRKLKSLISSPEHTPHTPQTETPSEVLAGLVVIGVTPAYHKKGIGSLLQQEFERIAKQKGAVQMQLSVRKNNQQAIDSYRRNGWEIALDQGVSFGMKKSLS